jgi:hypothetical protein
MDADLELETFRGSESSRFPDKLSLSGGHLYVSNMRGFYHGAGYSLDKHQATLLLQALRKFLDDEPGG